MRWALFTGGGKDATLALHRMRSRGAEVVVSATVTQEDPPMVRFHGVSRRAVLAHGAALGLRPVVAAAPPDRFATVFEQTLLELRGIGITGVVFGNIHLADVREWFESRTTAAGMVHEEPLWGDDPSSLVAEFLEAGYRSVVTGVDVVRGSEAWLGRTLDRALAREMEDAGLDPAGEFGEYHTFVYDGPGFRSPIEYSLGAPVQDADVRTLPLDLA